MADWTNSQMTGSPDDTVKVLEASNTEVSHTAGATTIQTLKTYTLPAGTMGPNDTLRITTMWTYTASTNLKTCTIKFGGSDVLAEAENSATGVAMQTIQFVRNMDAINAQECLSRFRETGFIKSTAAQEILAIDTTADVDITFHATVANAGEIVTLKSYIIELVRGS